MNRVAQSLKTLTRSGQARLIILIATSWIVVWGSIWSYSTYRTIIMDQWISSELDRSEKLIFDIAARENGASDPQEEYGLKLVHDGIDEGMVRRDRTDQWANRAKWAGPIGLAVIVFCGLGGLWVYRGFKGQAGGNR